MEAGGPEYKKIKTEFDEISKDVQETERILTRHKTTIEGSTAKLLKLDGDKEDTADDLKKVNEEKDQLTEKLKVLDE